MCMKAVTRRGLSKCKLSWIQYTRRPIKHLELFLQWLAHYITSTPTGRVGGGAIYPRPLEAPRPARACAVFIDGLERLGGR